MECIKTKKQVLTRDCDECMDNKQCPPICEKREYVLSTPPNSEPIFPLTIEQVFIKEKGCFNCLEQWKKENLKYKRSK